MVEFVYSSNNKVQDGAPIVMIIKLSHGSSWRDVIKTVSSSFLATTSQYRITPNHNVVGLDVEWRSVRLRWVTVEPYLLIEQISSNTYGLLSEDFIIQYAVWRQGQSLFQNDSST